MQLSEHTDKEVDNFISNYEKSGKTTGGKFNLGQLRAEKLRRIKSPFPPVDVAKTILALACGSHDGLVTYKEVWQKFRPESQWVGNAPRAEMAKALGAVVAYCIDNGMPILTTLVVQAARRSHSEQAILQIYSEAKSYGIEVGLDPKRFVEDQQEKSRKVTQHHS